MEFNLAVVSAAVAAAIPDRPAIIFRDRTLTHGMLDERTNRLANALVDRGLTLRAERTGLAGWESGQHHLAIYLHNGNEYLEAMIGAYKARVAPFNVNYRYVEEELVYLLNDAGATAIVFHSTFADRLTAVRDQVPSLQVLLQVADESDHALLDGAEWYEDALAAASGEPAPVEPGIDDLYILYTGGTTGMPKGVLWRQADIFPAALGGRRLSDGSEWATLDEIVEAAMAGGTKALPGAPFMHGAAHWVAFNVLNGGNTLVIPDRAETFDPDDVLRSIAAEQVNILLIVGDAFARPLMDAIERTELDLSSLVVIISGGAALSAGVKAELLRLLPSAMVVDAVGASETGQQGRQISTVGAEPTTGTFSPMPDVAIVSEDLTRVLAADDDELGWLAQTGHVPIGYLGDEDKTRRTFPVIDGVRYSVPGDRARYLPDGLIELHGRDSVTINTGGEKVFAEEVEAALARHPGVYDVVVAGRPSERWGSEVVAIVQLAEGAEASADDLAAECAKHLARYKVPKEFKFVDRIERSPAGKADYRWARTQAAD